MKKNLKKEKRNKMNKQVYHTWLDRVIKELYGVKKQNQFDFKTYKKLVHFRIVELQKCLEETILLDKDE